jgi:phosphatidylethanolamine/phosphatidyl-N-methylethanolamine N-methyltransferase
MQTTLQDTLAFTRRFITHYRQIGALVPSSQAVARVISAAMQPLATGQVIVELGAGTGVFTRQLLHDYPHNPIVAIELDTDLVTRLRRNCPTAHVVAGDASQLSAHLAELDFTHAQVGGIVSAIPFVSLPAVVRTCIFQAMAEVLPAGRPYAQITYFTGAWRKFDLHQWFTRDHDQRVWWNVPPAVVMRFIRK